MRNVFNRLLLALLGLAAFLGGLATLLLLAGWVTPGQLSPQGVLLPQWSFLARLHAPDATLAARVSIGLLCAGLLVLIIEVLPGRREPATFIVRRDALGTVAVVRRSVGDLIQYEAVNVPGIIEARQAVTEGRKGLRVRVRASLSPEVVVPEVGQTLQEKIQQALQRHLGLPVAEVQVATQVAPLESRGGRRVR
jgi:hypothetical protein